MKKQKKNERQVKERNRLNKQTKEILRKKEKRLEKINNQGKSERKENERNRSGDIKNKMLKLKLNREKKGGEKREKERTKGLIMKERKKRTIRKKLNERKK